MGFINFRGGKKADNYDALSKQAKAIEAAEQEKVGSHKHRERAADYFGVSDLAAKENNAVLTRLMFQKKEIDSIHDSLISGNTLSIMFDDTQLMKDFWMGSIAEIIDQGNLADIQRCKALQLLCTAFHINNPTTAQKHYLYIGRNESYQKYMERCFSFSENIMPGFWHWMQHLGNQPLSQAGKPGKNSKNRMDIVVYFINQYMTFMMTLSFYLSQVFPGRGCGRFMKEEFHKRLELISYQMTGQMSMDLDFSQLVNPLYHNPKDFSAENKGFEQTRNQSEGLKGAFDNLRKRFGKKNRVLKLIQLLDMCSESESTHLENEYNRMTRSL